MIIASLSALEQNRCGHTFNLLKSTGCVMHQQV